MAEKMNDGGPAFPHLKPHDPSFEYCKQGMSLRDWFAGQALAGMKPPTIYLGASETKESLRAHAVNAYRIADAMLAAREVGERGQ